MIVLNTDLWPEIYLMFNSVTKLYAEYDHELVKIRSQGMYITIMQVVV